MLTISFWRLFSARHRRHKSSFYDSQHLMREAAQSNAYGALSRLTDDELQNIADTESGTQRAEIARRALDERRKDRDKLGGGAA